MVVYDPYTDRFVDSEPTANTYTSDRTDAIPIRHFCRYKNRFCEFATDLGYCKITACGKIESEGEK